MDQKFEEAKERCRAKIMALNKERRGVIRLQSPPPTQTTKRVRVNRVATGPAQQQRAGSPPQQQHKQQQQAKPAPQQKQVPTPSGQDQRSDGPVLIYPPEKGGYAVYPLDLECLKSGRYLNDTIVNLTLTWARNHCEKYQNKGQVRVIDSHWFQQLTRGVQNVHNTEGTEKVKANLERLKRWFPDGHPFGQTGAIFPICANAHWVLVATVTKGLETTIFGFDSLRSGLTQMADAVLRVALGVSQAGHTIHSRMVNAKQQSNLTDCGLHTIHNGARLIWLLNNRSSINITEVEEYINQGVCPVERTTIQRLLGDIARCVPYVPQGIFPEPTTLVDLVMDLSISDSDEEVAAAEEAKGSCLIVPPGTEVVLTPTTTLRNITSEPWVIGEEEQLWLHQTVQQGKLDKEGRDIYRLRFKRTYEDKVITFCLRSRSSYVIISLKKQ